MSRKLQRVDDLNVSQKAKNIIADSTLTFYQDLNGDYYYSDGTWSSDYKASKTCIGIVFALSKEQDGDIDVSLKESMHGRIVALQDLDKKFQWASTETQYTPIENYYNYPTGLPKEGSSGAYPMGADLPLNGLEYYRGTTVGKLGFYLNDEFVLCNYYTWPTEKGYNYALTDYSGKTNCKLIKESDYFDLHYAIIAAMNYSTAYYWYLPSLGELTRLGMADAVGILTANPYIPLSKNSSYWSSTQNKNKAPWAYNPKTGQIFTQGYMAEYHVRPIASF